jgi:hypothetical protein
MKPTPPEALLELLARLATALEGNDPAAAGAASDGLTEVLAACVAGGATLTPAALAAAQALYQRCQEGATRVNASLRSSLMQSSMQRRAAESYAAGGQDSGSGRSSP